MPTLPTGYASIRATARLLGCAHPTLIQAMDDGRIPETAIVRDATGKRVGLDVRATREAMVANTDPVQSARRGPGWTLPAESAPPVPASSTSAPAPSGVDGYHEARAARERADAALAQLELAEKLGQLVSADAVTRAAFEAARSTRDALLSIPDRVAALLAAESDAANIHSILTTELRQALHGITDRLSRAPG